MTTLSIQPPFPPFADRAGAPLQNGYIWIGTAALNPITNPIAVYWDAALTQAAAQPIRTQGGYPVNNGTPARLYVGSDYSLLVQDSKGTLVYQAPNATERWSDVVVTGADASEVTFLQAGTGAQPRTAQSKMRDVVSVRDYGATGDGTTDDTSAIQAAIDYLKSTTRGGTLYFPRGTYKVSTINASAFGSAFDKNLRIVGDGVFATRIVGYVAGKIVIDFIGANNVEVEEIYIGTTAACQAGILLARSTTSQNCNGGRFTNVSIEGQFTIAALASIASESNVFVGCRFANTSAAASHKCLYTNSHNDIGIVSENGTLFASSNTDNRAYGCTFYAPYNDASVCMFERAAGWAFHAPLVITGGGTGGKLAHYKTGGTPDIFKGPVEWVDPLFEGLEPFVHFFEGTIGLVNYFYFIRQWGGYNNVYTSSDQFYILTNHDAGTSTSCYLYDSHFSAGRFNALSNVKAVASGFYNCFIDILCIDAASTTIQPLLVQDHSVFRASSILEAASGNYQATSFGTAAPAAGTYKAGHFQWNTNATTLALGLIGWSCTASGSPGTWAAAYRGILSGATGARPTGTKPTGLQFYDTTLSKPVWWDGTNWRDAAGTIA